MERRHNPYAPGAGLQPPELAGRDKLIEDAAIDMDRLLDRRPTKGMMLLGLRGVGKTVVLNRLHHMANEKGIHTAKIEAPEGGTMLSLAALG
jgi:Cdc6-like AAA superfamily ATPase